VASLHAQQPSYLAFGTTVVIPSGLRGDIYHIRAGTHVLPRFDNRKSVGTIWTTQLNITPRHWRDGFPGVTQRNKWFAINYTGRFWIERAGSYAFALLSDDGAMLFIDDQVVVDNDCLHPPDVRAALVNLRRGVHQIRVGYFQGPPDCLALVLAVAPPGESWRVFSTDEFKPPQDPDDWHLDNAGTVAPRLFVQPYADLNVRELLNLLGDIGPEGTHPPAHGCYNAPRHYCGK
jgi:PA14 domain